MLPPTSWWAPNRGAADIGGTTHKTGQRVIERAEAGREFPVRAPRPSNVEGVRELVTRSVKFAHRRVSAKRLLTKARAAAEQAQGACAPGPEPVALPTHWAATRE